MKRVKINAYEVGLLFENDKLKTVLTEGKYWVKNKVKVMVHSKLSQFKPVGGLDILLLNKELYALLDVFEVMEDEILLVKKNNILQSVMNKGVYAFWKEPIAYTFEQYSTSELEVPKAINKKMIQNSILVHQVNIVEVYAGEKALLYVNDKLEKILDAGVYLYWKNADVISAKKVDTRKQLLELAGQEILTADKANIRINFNVMFNVVDILKALEENKDYLKQLYNLIQIHVRSYIGQLTLDELLDTKDAIGNYIIKETADKVAELGVGLISAGIKDVILPGDIKEIMNQVLVAQKKAHANMITRKEETAATRSLLNTAKLMEDNEMLYKLKEMEYVEKISEKIGELTINGNGGVISQLKEIFTGKT